MKILLTKDEREKLEEVCKKLDLSDIKDLISDKNSIEFPSYITLGWLKSIEELMKAPVALVLKDKFTVPLKKHIREIIIDKNGGGNTSKRMKCRFK